MRLIELLYLMTMIDSVFLLSQPSSSHVETGATRLRLRSHRRRHRHRGNHVQVDELFEMLTEEKTREKDERETGRRQQKSATPRRDRNEPLCATDRRTVDLNTETEEYDPPFLVEFRCRNTANFENGITETLQEQKCVHDLLRCVQRYGEVHVSMRPIGSAHWLPHTLRDIPLGCDCMWPVDKYGHQEL